MSSPQKEKNPLTIKGDELVISSQEWDYLNDIYDKDDIKLMISNAIGDNDLPMPMRKITFSDCDLDFQNLKKLDSTSIVKNESWFTRYNYDSKYFFNNILFSCCNVGNKASDFYQQENRWRCDSITAPSPYRSWTIEKFRLTLLNALWTLKYDHVDSKVLRSCIGLRKYIASQFRPSTAKAVYDYFNAKNVLDFSSGWGDRLCGFMASSAESYTGIDPNKNLFPKYHEMINEIGPRNKTIDLINDGAENVDLSSKKFDLIFTSPPYYTLERYTQEDNQSWKKYKKLNNWLDGFLFATLEKCWNSLEIGGKIIINISDVYAKHTRNEICDPMNEFMSTLHGSKYFGCCGYEMRKRPNAKSIKGKTGKFAEPMWIWEKLK